jgi:hypothetical protein
MVHIYSPSHLGGRDRRIMVQDKPGRDSERPYLKNKLKNKGLVA